MAEWTEWTLRDLLHVVHGWPFRSEFYVDQPVSSPIVVAIGNFDYSGGFRFESTNVKGYRSDYPPEYVLAAGEVVLVMTCQTEGGEILGVPARIPDDGRVYLHNQRIGKVVVDRPGVIDLGFFYQYARSALFNRQLFTTASGSKILHTSPARIGDARLLLPPLDEQRAIADVLGALDDKIAANTKLATTASDLAMLLYRRAVSAVGRVAMSSWLEPVLGGTPARSNADFWGGDVPWTSAKDVTGAGHGVVLDTDEHITAHAASTTKAKPLPEGSVILTARGTVGAVARLGVPAAFNQSCYGFIPGDIPPGVLYFAVLSAADEARSLAHGSVFDTITMRTFDHLGFPDLDNASMTALESEVGPLLNSVTAVERENQRLAAARDALLPALMSGRLRVEETAEVAGL